MNRLNFPASRGVEAFNTLPSDALDSIAKFGGDTNTLKDAYQYAGTGKGSKATLTITDQIEQGMIKDAKAAVAAAVAAIEHLKLTPAPVTTPPAPTPGAPASAPTPSGPTPPK